MKAVVMRRFKRGTGKGEKGQSMVEFVLILPVFLLLVFAVMDFGMGFHAWLTVTNSAREGARLGAVRADQPSIEQRVRDTADSLDQADLAVTVANAQGDPGESVIVDVDYRYDLITPIDNVLALVGGSAIGPTLTFSSKADMRLE